MNMKDANKIEVKESKTITSNAIAKTVQELRSAKIFRGNIILKSTYQACGLIKDKEIDTCIDMPNEELLAILPYLENEGMDAANTFLIFSDDGIAIKDDIKLYSHYSREKMAILYMIICSELKKNLYFDFILKDGLKSIKKMSQLAEYVTNLKQHADIQKILEKNNDQEQKSTFKPIVNRLNEELLPLKVLAAKLNLHPSTIKRNPKQFIPHRVGKRNQYYLSECLDYNKN